MAEINICMITDNNYVIPTAVAITSAISHKKDTSVYHFYLLVNNISNFNRKQLEKLAGEQVVIDFIETDIAKYESIMVKTHVSQAAALKFDVPNIIGCDRILYIDGDILVREDLEELFNVDMEDCLIAAVRDMGGEVKLHFNDLLGTENYFNSGVMLLDLAGLRRGDYPVKLEKAKRENPQWKCMDQDAFNFVFKDRVKWLDVRYNAMIPQYRMHRFSQSEINRFYGVEYDDENEMQSDAAIIHFAGESGTRPWKVVNGTFGDLWDAYYRQSPYRDISLNRSLTAGIRPQGGVTSYNLFGCVPLWKRKRCTNGDFRFYLFGFIPMFRIKNK